MFQRSLITSLLLPELEERGWRLLCPTTKRVMPVYRQNVLPEAQHRIAAGILDPGLPPLAELIRTCRLKVKFGVGEKVEKITVTAAEISVKWPAQDECPLSPTSSKSHVAFSSADLHSSRAPVKSEGVMCTLQREGLVGLRSVHSVKALVGKFSTNHFSSENADSSKQAFYENKRAIFPHFSNSKYCGSFK